MIDPELKCVNKILQKLIVKTNVKEAFDVFIKNHKVLIHNF
jgi:hypothetical protein